MVGVGKDGPKIPVIETLSVELNARTKKFGSGMKLALGTLAALGAGAAYTFAKFETSQKVLNQTGAVLQSTGGAAHVSSKQVTGLANRISKVAGINDEAVRAGENMLLTFTNIRNETGKGNDIFTQSTKTLIDMATALGQDIPKSAIQMGKALNDPIKGMTALRRVGVTFTEQQIAQVKAMVKSGNLLGAQKLILRELTSEFGGSAAAQATSSGKMRVAMDNLAEGIGGVLAPVITALIGPISAIANIFTKFPAIAVAVAGALGVLAAAYVVAKVQALLANAAFLANPFVLVAAAAVLAAVLIVKNWSKVRAFFVAVFDWIKSHWVLLTAILLGPFAAVVIPIVRNFDKIKAAAMAVFNFALTTWQWLSRILVAPFHLVWAVVGPILNTILSILQRIIGVASRAVGIVGKALGGAAHLVGKIPGFQHGGVMPHTGLALLHAGETVIPSYAGGVGGSISGDIVLQINGREFGRVAWNPLLKMKTS